MSQIEAVDVLGAFQSATQIYLMAKANQEQARLNALKAGYTEEELQTIRDDALASIIEPLVDPLG